MIIVGGSLWIYHNPNAALVALGIFVVFTWPIILGWGIYLPLCWWHGVKPRAPWKPWVPLKQHEPWRRRRRPRRAGVKRITFGLRVEVAIMRLANAPE